MTREDEIMAGHLLKGGKMLSSSCKTCGCPLFEVRGETLCVVCAEKDQSGKSESPAAPPGEKTAAPADLAGTGQPAAPGRLAGTLEETLILLCGRIQEEKDPRCVAALMEAVARGIEGLNALRSGGTHL